MELKTERDENTLTATVEGRIDSTNALEFEEAIRTAIVESDRAVIMDLKDLAYISSAGLRAILMAAKHLWKQDAKLLLHSLSDSVGEVFEISGFNKIIPIHETRDQALGALQD